MDPNWVVNHAYNAASYILEHDNPIQDGETIDGVADGQMSREIQWKCQYEDALIQDVYKRQVEEQFTTIHNYIDTDAMILRKGAVSAKEGERLLIPINMRDGSLLLSLIPISAVQNSWPKWRKP